MPRVKTRQRKDVRARCKALWPTLALVIAAGLVLGAPLGAFAQTARGARVLGSGLPAGAEGALAQPAMPIVRERLEWTPNPGAFEQELRRRIGNPLFSPERQIVRAEELRAAKIRDAADARAVLSDVVDLSLDRAKLARAESLDEMRPAMKRYQGLLRTAMGVGGEGTQLAESLRRSRATLIEQWREAHEDAPEILGALEEIERSGQLDEPASTNTFAAQLLRDDGPIAPGELTPALLSESPETIDIVLGTFDRAKRSQVRLAGLELIRNLQSLGVEIEGEQAKVDLLTAGG